MRIVVSEEELEAGVVFIKSDFWQGKDEWVWTASHPSGWSVQGHSPDPETAQDEIERRAAEALEWTFEESVRINRIHHDGPSPN